MAAVTILVWLPTTETVELIVILLAGITAAFLASLALLMTIVVVAVLLGWLR